MGASTRRKRPTQSDVARRAGVSVGIVSSVINNRQYGNIRISEATRQRVMEAVRELGYAPNLAARGLAGGSNRLVGVFTFQRLFPLANEDFFHEFLVGIEEAAEEAGYNLLLLTAAKDAAGRRSLFPQGTNGMQLADGGVLIGWDERVEEIRRLADEGFPFVYLGRHDIAGLELSYVAADYEGATRRLTEAVLTHGRRPAYVDVVDHIESVPGRQAGFRAAMLAAGREPLMLALPADAADSEYAELIERGRGLGVDCLIAENARTASSLERAVRGSGSDVQVIGLGGAPDDEEGAALSGLAIPRREMGREAVRLLLCLLDDPQSAPVRSTLPCEIRVPH
ncbi:LacI family DNA-binding transcriptional regulator [Dactylosporangium sp. CA-233914]|uniref:LacI family DNA-binding transcriptional regulator n=1 Tax=Dactylosporangium sp. CA-233914 TaxID=3239934 RepID=UPI003D92D18E